MEVNESVTPEGSDVEGIDTSSIGAETTKSVVDAVPEWDGSWDKVSTLPWFGNIPEAHRTLLGATVTKAQAETAQLRKDLGAAKSAEDLYNDLMNGDDNAAKVVEWSDKYKTVEQERDTLRAEVEALHADILYSAIERDYPDISADYKEGENGASPTGAFVDFVTLLQSGIDRERAAKMVRATTAEQVKPVQPEEVPPDVELASSNAKNGKKVKRAESFEEAARRLRESS